MKSPRDIIQAAQTEGRTALFEHEAKSVAHAVGITVPRWALADPNDPRAVVAAADALGYPVALKAVSPDILHKTESGAVMLNIATSVTLTASVTTMKNMINRRLPGATIRSFLIEKMMPPGLDLLVGGLRDPQFGPCVSFGLGGVWVEALKDAVFGILPLDHGEMQDMISRTRAALFLKGFRGSPALDEEAVHLMITNVASLLNDHPEIKEIDMNPVRVYARSAIALDARILLTP
jgi:acyl-CoA synthetase (NDP forming)